MQFLPRNCEKSTQRTYRNIGHDYNTTDYTNNYKDVLPCGPEGPVCHIVCYVCELSGYGRKFPGTYNRKCKNVQKHHRASFKGTTFTLSGVLHSAALTRSSPKNEMGSFRCTIGPMTGDLVQNHNKTRYNYGNGHSNKRNTQTFVINLKDYSMEAGTNKRQQNQCSGAGVKQHSLASLY